MDNYLNCSEQSHRYNYDEIGNLVSDNGEYIAMIEWTVDRKVKRVIRDSLAMLAAGVTKPDIEYDYNPLRQRVVKLVKPRDAVTKKLKSDLFWTYTFYVYDAGGNVMSVYTKSYTALNGLQYRHGLSLSEHHVYGSSRLAIQRPSNELLAMWSQTVTLCGNNCRTPAPLIGVPPSNGVFGRLRDRQLGYKEFELGNHLGNVIATVSDRKLQIRACPEEIVDDNALDEPEDMARLSIVSGEWGIENKMLRMRFNDGEGGMLSGVVPTELGKLYRWQFDLTSDFMRSLVARVVPVHVGSGMVGAPQMEMVLSSNGQVVLTYRAVDAAYPEVRLELEVLAGGGVSELYVNNWKVVNVPGGNLPGLVNPPLTGGPDGLNPPCNVIGNVFGGYFPDLLMHTDYYGFGQEMPGRTWSASSYRYSHNGHEREDEIFEGAQSAEFWMYDSRVGRRWERDPITYPWQSPYAAFNNNPIYFADPRGLKGDDKAKPGSKENPINGGNLPEVDVFAPPLDQSVEGIRNAEEGVGKVEYNVTITYDKEGVKPDGFKHYDRNNDLTSQAGKYTTNGKDKESFYKRIVTYNLQVFPDRTGNYDNGFSNYFNIDIRMVLDGRIVKSDNFISIDEVNSFDKKGVESLFYKDNTALQKQIEQVQREKTSNQIISNVYIEMHVSKIKDQVNNYTQFKKVVREKVQSILGSDADKVNIIFVNERGGRIDNEDGIRKSGITTTIEVLTIEREQ